MAQRGVYDSSSDSDVEILEDESDNGAGSLDSLENGMELFASSSRASTQVHNMRAEVGRLRMKIEGLKGVRSQLIDDKGILSNEILDLQTRNVENCETIINLRQENAILQAQLAQQAQPNANELADNLNDQEAVGEIAVVVLLNQNGARELQEGANRPADENRRENSETSPKHGVKDVVGNVLGRKYVCTCGKLFKTGKALSCHIGIHKFWGTREFSAN